MSGSTERTWGQGLAIGTPVIARNRADQLGQGLLIAQLLALADAIRHGGRIKEWTQYKDCEKVRTGEKLPGGADQGE